MRFVLASLLFLAASGAWAQDSVALRISFLDVGQGDAVVIQAGGKTALIDAGPADGDIIRQLRGLAVDTIDLVVASHAHADHIGGMAQVLATFVVRSYIDNGLPHTTATYRTVMAALRRSTARYATASPATVTLGEVTLQLLPPPPHGDPTDQNNHSVGLLVRAGAFRALLTGDSEVDEIHYLLTLGLPVVNVLKAAHHGSRNGVTPAWLSALKPDVVVISLGRDNRYGHPHPWAMRYYNAMAPAIYRTDLHGTVTIALFRDGHFTVSTTRPAGAADPGPKGRADR